jgi:hypothetical protein
VKLNNEHNDISSDVPADDSFEMMWQEIRKKDQQTQQEKHSAILPQIVLEVITGVLQTIKSIAPISENRRERRRRRRGNYCDLRL